MVTLSNGRIFIAKDRRVTRASLPGKIRPRRRYMQRAAPRGRLYWQIAVQQGRRLGSNILMFAKKISTIQVVRKLCKMALNELRNLYNKGTSKIKNKKI